MKLQKSSMSHFHRCVKTRCDRLGLYYPAREGQRINWTDCKLIGKHAKEIHIWYSSMECAAIYLAVYWVNIELPSSSFSRCANCPRLIASLGVRLLLFRLIASSKGRMFLQFSSASTSSSLQLSNTTFLSWNPRFARSGLNASKASPSFILSYSRVMRLGWSTSRLITPSVLTLFESRMQKVSWCRAPCKPKLVKKTVLKKKPCQTCKPTNPLSDTLVRATLRVSRLGTCRPSCSRPKSSKDVPFG